MPRLKFSPKKALSEINAIIKAGQDLKAKIQNDYLKKGRVNFGPDFSGTTGDNMNFVILGEGVMAEYREWYLTWLDESTKKLEEFFQDYADVNEFSRISEIDLVSGGGLYGAFTEILKVIQLQLGVLRSFHKEIADLIRSPIYYLPDQCKIFFYEIACPLTPDTQESEMCKFLFEKDFGEKVEALDIYEYITGTKEAKLGQKERDRIKNTYIAINKKSKEVFGFEILEKQKTLYSVKIPVQYLPTSLN